MKRCAIHAPYCTMINYHGAAHGSAIVHAVIFHSRDLHRLVVCTVPALLCVMDWRKGLDIIIRCRNRLKRVRGVRPVWRWDLTFGSTIPFDTVSCSGGFFHRLGYASSGLRENAFLSWRMLLWYSEVAVWVPCVLGFIPGIRGKEFEWR